MSLAKLTATGDVHLVSAWARPDIYERWLALLALVHHRTIIEAMNLAVDERNVVRAQYIVCPPGKGDSWYPIYGPVYRAMNSDREMAGKFIGLILWEVMSNRPEQWYFHKIDKTIFNENYNLIEDIQVMEYFRADTLPALAEERERERL